MRILHVVAGLPESGGGLSELVPRFAVAAAQLGHEVTLATVAAENDQLSSATLAAAATGVRIMRHAPAAPRPLFFSWDMMRQLPALARAADLVHVHSNWTFPVWWGCQSAIQAGKPLVMSPQGCLDPVRLSHSAGKKRLAGLVDRRLLRQAAAIHATSDMERDWIERYVGTGPRIYVIPNGVELPAVATPAAKPPSRTRQLLYVGRLHPLKGLDLLLDAWGRVRGWRPDGQPWQLVVAGPDELGTRRALEEQARSSGLTDVSFSGAVYGADKAAAFTAADLFVLPSRSENFGIVVAEALAAGVPVITTRGTPWSEIDRACGWWVDATPASLAAALDAAMRLSDAERLAMGAIGRALVESRYQWPAVGRAMVEAYQELVGPDPRASG